MKTYLKMTLAYLKMTLAGWALFCLAVFGIIFWLLIIDHVISPIVRAVFKGVV